MRASTKKQASNKNNNNNRGHNKYANQLYGQLNTEKATRNSEKYNGVESSRCPEQGKNNNNNKSTTDSWLQFTLV